MLDQLEVYDDVEPRAAALNMAMDEALLEIASSPVLRFYRWRSPALSFGYFGSFADVGEQRANREIVRRWTGGGVVPHGDDLTYSVVIPAGHAFFARSSLQIYSELHDAIRRALNTNGVEATLARAVAPKISEHCFSNAVRADVLSGGRKIAGAAHRRTRAGLLHQGSIQLPGLPAKFRDDFARALCPKFERKALAPELIARGHSIAQAKYATDEWLMRR
ncbi:MAG: lipoyl(octanoyl) transferase [Verrucomicrobiota bacterium]|jgi:lipoate-protein ligase A